MPNKTSQHIMGTSANLLGFCLFILTSLHITNSHENFLLDEFTSVVALLLATSTLLSFLSIRSENSKREIKLEQIADYLFFSALVGIMLIVFFLILNFSFN